MTATWTPSSNGTRADLPSFTLTLFGPDGSEVDLETDDGVSYETATSSGTSVDSVAIDTPGDHVLRVESDDADFVIAVGRNPNDGVLLLRVLAIGVAVAGIVIGVSLLVRARRRNEASSTDVDAWVPSGADPEWPMSPPGSRAPAHDRDERCRRPSERSVDRAVVGAAAVLPNTAHQRATSTSTVGGADSRTAGPWGHRPRETARWGPPPPPAGKRPGG